MSNIPVEVWAAFTTGREQLLQPVRARVADGQLLTQEEQIGLLEALAESVRLVTHTKQRNVIIEDQLKNFRYHLQGGEKLVDELIDTLKG